MAGYAAVIDLRVNGLDGLRTVSDRIESINRLIKQIKPVPTLFDKRGNDELKAAKQSLDNLIKAYADGGNRSAAFSTSVAGLNQQLSTFRSVAANAKTGSDQFTNALKAAEIATNRLNKAELQRLDTVKDLYTRRATGGLTAEDQGPSGLTRDVLALGKQLPASIAGLRAYGSELDRIFNLVEAGSVDYRTLQREIARVNAAMGMMTGAGPIQGPALPPGFTERGRRPQPSPQRTGQGGVNRLESIALGVGFPLLFGGGAGEIAGSFLGSFAGKGFGGQILGGAFGGILDDFITKAGELGSALNPLTADIDVLVTALGGATTSAGQYIAKLEELGRSEEALAAATEELKNLVGVDGVEALQEFGADSTKLQSVFTQAMTQMQASVASLINSTGILKALTAGIERNVLLRQALQSKDPRQQEALRQREQASGPAFFGADPEAYFAAEEQLIKNQRLINEEKQKQYDAQLKILTAEEKQVEIAKEIKKLTQELGTEYSKLTQESRKRIEAEKASVDLGLSVSSARYNAEKAIVDLEKTRLERAYEYATTQKERLDIAVALFENAATTAKLEYKQQLENIAASEQKLQIELNELNALNSKLKLRAAEAKLIAETIKDDERRNARLSAIDATLKEALDNNQEAVNAVQEQLIAQQAVNEYQKQAAEAQLQNKLLAAQTALEQRLVSEEIGLSQEQARRLGESMRIVKEESILTTNQTQQIVGVIEVGTEKTYIMAQAMSDVAAQASNAAAQIGAAVNAQLQLNAARQASAQTAAPQQAAEGAYWSGGFKAFADGGMVSQPTLGLVGEGGEPEYIIPASKMNEAMARYASGQRGSSVIPNAATSEAGSYSAGTSSINPVVNVTTGPVMNMNNRNYVSQADFLAGLQVASRQGAQMALATLQGNNSMRRSVGIR